MAIGDPGQEQFRDAIMELRNHDIATAMRPLIEFRHEVTHSEDMKNRGGLDTPSCEHFLAWLGDCDRWRRRVTHNPDDGEIGMKIAEAIDAKLEISDATKPFGGDDIQMGATHLFPLPWDLSGADPNLPLTSHLNMGSFGHILLLGIDTSIVAWTRLESRNRSRAITRHDSLRIYGLYQRIFAGLETFGGDGNQMDIAQVLATDEPRGPENAPNRRTETATGGSSK